MSNIYDPDPDPWNPPTDLVVPAGGQSRASGAVNLWEGYDASLLQPPTKWTCPHHGSNCTPGICEERARFRRDKRMKDAREKWEVERRQREAQRVRKAIGEGEIEGRSHPQPLCRTASSTSSGSDSDKSHKQGTVYLGKRISHTRVPDHAPSRLQCPSATQPRGMVLRRRRWRHAVDGGLRAPRMGLGFRMV